MSDALIELAKCERESAPNEEMLDVAYSPSRVLGDLAAHPPIRSATLALSSWPAVGDSVTAREVELASSETMRPSLLRWRDRDHSSPLHRLRSTTAPVGVFRLLTGFSLIRQHAPWALDLGPLRDLEHLPRMSIDGFVVSLASWRIPVDLDSVRAVGRWRKRHKVPPTVQVGLEDELLFVSVELDKSAVESLLRTDPGRRPRAYRD